MARLLHLLPSTALSLSIQNTETLLKGLRQPIDELNAHNANIVFLSALLDGRRNADLLIQCLSKSALCSENISLNCTTFMKLDCLQFETK